MTELSCTSAGLHINCTCIFFLRQTRVKRKKKKVTSFARTGSDEGGDLFFWGKKSFQRQIDSGSHITAGKVTAAAAAAAVICSAVHSSGPAGVSRSNLHPPPTTIIWPSSSLITDSAGWSMSHSPTLFLSQAGNCGIGGGNKAGTARRQGIR